jgi:iron(III) transport system substrate-binding protein
MSGNKHVAQAVGGGQLAWGLTDTDDALAELDAGRPAKIIYPDQGAGEPGTLYIPNTVAILKGAPHADAARRLADYLLTPEVETRLSLGPAGQIPLHPSAESSDRVQTPATVRAMAVDWNRAGAVWDETARFLRDEFSGE